MSLILSSCKSSGHDATKLELQHHNLVEKECRCYALQEEDPFLTQQMDSLQNLLATAQSAKKDLETELAYLTKTHLDLKAQIKGLEGRLETILEEKETESDLEIMIDLASLLDQSC